MDFDLSKENIQPLRGGRNVTHLEVALQAQSDSDLQRELIQQKESFEAAIRTYEGDDPLENWYSYIYWVEQSYPKHGHEGNLVPLLEDCLSKFENEQKYIHDRRLCKLWIKYIDLQQNPLELFQLLHSKGICVSCADLFRAWAYYHEVAGDHKRADAVFELGISALAQPYEDLVLARNNMYTAIGRQAVTGVDERRLVDQRHALTSLRPFIQRRTTMVPNIRTGCQVLNNTPGVVQQSLLMNDRAGNTPITLYEDQAVAGSSVGGAAAAISILDVARRQEVVHKENTLKPGQWNSKMITGTRVGQHRDPNFIIHVDDEPAPPEGIRLPHGHAPLNHDDFSTWQTLLYFPEPTSSNQVRMYPKHLVYADEPTMEYSPEEIRARKWFASQSPGAAAVPANASINMQETISEEANIMNASSQAAVAACQAVPSSSQTESYSLPRPSLTIHNTQQQLVPNASSQFPEQASLRQSISNQNRQQTETTRDSQYHVQDSSQYHSTKLQVRASSQYPNQQSFNAEMDQRHSAQYHNYNSDAQNMRQSSQYYPQADTQSFRQSTHYQQQNYVPEMQNQTLAQQSSVQNYSLSEAGQSYGQNAAAQNYNTDVQNESSSQYQQPIHNYQTVQNVSTQQSYTSSKNIAIYQDQPNTSAEIYTPRPSYPAQPRQSYAAQPSALDPVTKGKPAQTWSNSTLSAEDNYTANMREAMKDINDIWKDNLSTMQEPVVEVKTPEIVKFQIHEDTKFLQDDTDARKSVVKSAPFAIFTDETCASPVVPKSARKQPLASATGSLSCPNEIPYESTASARVANAIPIDGRYSRAPFASQPLPDREFELPRKSISHSQPIVSHSAENHKSTAIQNVPGPGTPGGFNDSCTTQMFNFNLNTLQAHSTPFHYKKAAAQQYSNVTLFANDESEDAPQCVSKKVLFDACDDAKKQGESYMPQEETCMPEKLSVILETTKEYRSSSSSSSGGTTLKTTTFNFMGNLNAIPESVHQQTNDESALEAKTNDANRSLQDETSPVNDYNMLKDMLRSGEDNDQQYIPSMGFMDGYNHNESKRHNQQNNPVIDLTEDDSGKARKSHYMMRFSEAGDVSGFNLLPQQQLNQTNELMKHFESPDKNLFKGFESPVKPMQFYENSNDSVTRSPAKGSRMMDVDAALHAQNSNSEFKMDYDSYQEAPVGYLENAILQKPPSDPFANKLLDALLKKVGFPSVKYAKCYVELQTLPRIGKKDCSRKEMVCLGEEKFHIEKVIGKGAFGTVYKAINDSTNAMVALKLQKPANKWEFYICKEVRERLANRYMLNAFMDVSTCYVSHTASIIVSEFFKLGSLLDLTNKVKQVTGKGVKELVAIYYASEIVTILNALHQCRIIHADIKPDNFLVTRMPPEYGHPSLQLIDFGCSIDMSLFPAGTTFTKVISTENFTCTEMKDGRPWTYQTDMFCLAATVHVLLFEKYMQVQKRGDVWAISQNIPRYMRKDLWNTFFYQMLNIDGCDKLPDLGAIKTLFEPILSAQSEELQVDMRFVANSIYGR